MIHFAAPHPSLTFLPTIYLWPAGVELSRTQETRYCPHAPILLNSSGHVPCLGSYRHSPLCFPCPWLTSQCFPLSPRSPSMPSGISNSRTDTPPDILHEFQNIPGISWPLRILRPSHPHLRLGGPEVTSLVPVPLADHCFWLHRGSLGSPALWPYHPLLHCQPNGPPSFILALCTMDNRLLFTPVSSTPLGTYLPKLIPVQHPGHNFHGLVNSTSLRSVNTDPPLNTYNEIAHPRSLPTIGCSLSSSPPALSVSALGGHIPPVSLRPESVT